MNILVVNKYYKDNGGTETFIKTFIEEANKLGHRCIPFSVKFSESWPSQYEDYFLSAPAGDDASRYELIKFNFRNTLRTLGRVFYSFEAKNKLASLLRSEKIDIALVVNIYNYMSPSVLSELSKNKIPTVMWIGDYNILCPSFLLLRDGLACFKCLNGRFYYGVIHRCVKSSVILSAVRAASMYLHRAINIWDSIDLFMAPCEFTRRLFAANGFLESKLCVMKYPIPIPMQVECIKKEYILFFGRISPEKGVDKLIDAFISLDTDVKLLIVGNGFDGELDRLKKIIPESFSDKIIFLGFKKGAELSTLISEALISVVPSRWHDNAPLSVLESLAHGTAVLGARMGGITDQIIESVDGLLFDPDDKLDLRQKLQFCLDNKRLLLVWGDNGRKRMEREYASQKCVRNILNKFSEIIQSKKI